MQRFSIFTWFGYQLHFEQSLELIRNAGFTNVMLWWGETDGEPSLFHQAELAAQKGAPAENAHLPFDGCNTLWLPGEEGEHYTSSILHALEDCARVDIPVLVVHLSHTAHPPPPSDIGISRLHRAAEAAAKHGTVLALENLRTPLHLHTAMEALRGAEVGFCYDSGHHQCWCPKEPLTDTYGHRLTALHLHDNKGEHDEHLLPFDGAIDWAALARSLTKTPYSGPIGLEVQAYHGYETHMSAEAFLDAAFTAAKRIGDMITNSPHLHNVF